MINYSPGVWAVTKIFKTPFAETGDKISPPDAVQPDGSVSYSVGYGFDYQRDTSLDGGVPVDPLAKVFPREQHNGILNDITTAIGEIQVNGLPIWQLIAAPYPINAQVRHSGKNWRSLVTNNSTTPAEGESWTETSGKFVGLGAGLPIQLQQIGLTTAIRAIIGSTDLGAIWTEASFSPSTKITGDFCPAAGFASGVKTSPYFMHSPSNDVIFLAPLASPVFTGSPQAITQSPGTNNGVLATTAFVMSAISAMFPKASFSGNDFIRIPEKPGGLIVQWGTVSYPDIAPDAELPITFPVPFPSSVFGVSGTARTVQSSVNVTVRNPTNTGAAIVVREGDNGTYPGSVFWIAIGY